MAKIKIFCVSNIESNLLEKLNLTLVGVGMTVVSPPLPM